MQEEEALKLSDEIGVKKAATQLGLKYYTLADWQSKRKEQQDVPKLPESEQQQKIRESEHETAVEYVIMGAVYHVSSIGCI